MEPNKSDHGPETKIWVTVLLWKWSQEVTIN